jgi:hypothetical protein|tara:strand:- start:1260 stop:1535 length:276 start_codon:yes stop_codon:yes gene_type:complete
MNKEKLLVAQKVYLAKVVKHYEGQLSKICKEHNVCIEYYTNPSIYQRGGGDITEELNNVIESKIYEISDEMEELGYFHQCFVFTDKKEFIY